MESSDGARPRVFCISMQRNATTSVGQFLRDFGWRWAGWPADEANGWSFAWYRGDFEAIFSSPDFLAANGFEDSPWWLPGFYKVVFHRFPDARFILFTRDEDAWFKSMLNHSYGAVVGDNRTHAHCYRRELEFHTLLAAGAIDDDPEGNGRLMRMEGLDAHYKAVYRLHNTEVRDFFGRHGPHRLHLGELEDPRKWQRLGAFLGVEVPPDYDPQLNVGPPWGRSITPL